MTLVEPRTPDGSTVVVETVIESSPRDVDGLAVRRVLPGPRRTNVGPFLFVDHFGPTTLADGRTVDVRPHPHIGLATVTYLFSGELVHRDSLGCQQRILPGAIGWMTAGRGIVHSERSPRPAPASTTLHGIQLWVALPRAHEEVDPDFHHHEPEAIPELELEGARVRVLVGEAFGARSPVRTRSRMHYVDVRLAAGSTLRVPDLDRESAVYVVEGAIESSRRPVGSGTMVVLPTGTSADLHASSEARLVLLGGEPLDGPRHLRWNFVSSSRERIDRAADDWRAGRFPRIPGDDVEFIPLPD